jgi:ornithine cyclodeaminase/alanine dehydrogenase-like protein (mu-crystallin family)
MPILVLTDADVEDLLPAHECVELMSATLADLARGALYQPLRQILTPPGAKGVMGLMPAYRSGEQALYGLKAICVFPGNPARGLDAHQGSVLLFSGETGELLAVANASAITAVRTAAVTAVATRALAREDAGDLALLGASVQARSHLATIACVRAIRRVRVASRSLESARAFAEREQAKYSFPIVPVESVEGAVRDADIVVAVTSAREPVLCREWLSAGAHVNLVGASMPTAREADAATVEVARFFVDNRESAFNESGDLLMAMRERGLGPEHVRAELGEVLVGSSPGRTSSEEITLFKSLGLAVEDLASAEYVYRKACRERRGTSVEF